MVRTKHIPSSFNKRINGSLADYIVTAYPEKEIGPVSLVRKESADLKISNQVFEKKLPAVQKNDQEQFKEWCMPDQSSGYIKASKHGLL